MEAVAAATTKTTAKARRSMVASPPASRSSKRSASGWPWWCWYIVGAPEVRHEARRRTARESVHDDGQDPPLRREDGGAVRAGPGQGHRAFLRRRGSGGGRR